MQMLGPTQQAMLQIMRPTLQMLACRRQAVRQTRVLLSCMQQVIRARQAAITLEKEVSSRDILQPLGLHYISAQFAILPDQVSTEDIILMKDNEEIFEEWRRMVGEAVNHVFSSQMRGYDSRREIEYFTQDKNREWLARASAQTGKGFMATVKDGARDTAFAVGTGLITGALIGPKSGLALSGLTPAVKPLLQLFGRLAGSISQRRIRVSFDHHLLAIGVKQLR